MENSEPYTVLGIKPGASEEEIKTAFRREAKRTHPDNPRGDEQRFKKILTAYETVLVDAKTRPARPTPTSRARSIPINYTREGAVKTFFYIGSPFPKQANWI